MDFEIKRAVPDDTEDILVMMREFADFEDLTGYLAITPERLAAALFDDGAFAECSIARLRGEALGYAIYFPTFATFRGERGLYLEDLFVRPGHRGRSVGLALFRAVAARAHERGFERLDFVVLDWNQQAIDFYFKLGVSRNDDERHFTLRGSEFAAAAG